MKSAKPGALLPCLLCLLAITGETISLLTDSKPKSSLSVAKTLSNTETISETAPLSEEDRKLSGKLPSYEGSREAADSREESPLNKVSHTSDDNYDQMDMVVNDIKQVGFILGDGVEWDVCGVIEEGQSEMLEMSRMSKMQN